MRTGETLRLLNIFSTLLLLYTTYQHKSYIAAIVDSTHVETCCYTHVQEINTSYVLGIVDYAHVDSATASFQTGTPPFALETILRSKKSTNEPSML